MRALVLALAFLTRLPVPSVTPAGRDMARAPALFPLVGVVVAALAVAARALVEPLWGPAAGTVAGIFVAVTATGAFHEDGLADTADGLWGGWDAEQRQAIMRDSRLGTYGMVALLGLFALRLALLVPVPLGTFAAALTCAHVLGRAAPLLAVRCAPALESSSAARIAAPLDRPATAVALLVTVGVPALAAGPAGLVALAVGAGATLAAARLFRRRLGGVTGDTLGATVVTVEVCVVATVLALG